MRSSLSLSTRTCGLLLVIFTFITSPSHAQNAEEGVDPVTGPPPKISGRKAWILCTAIPYGVPNPASVMVGEEIHQITLSIRHMSDPFPVRGDGIVRMVKQVPNPDQPDVPAYETIAQATVPKNVEKALIILAPKPSNDGTKLVYISKVLDLKDFKGGDYLYLNLSPRSVGVTLGEVRHVLKPGELKIQGNREITAATNKMFSMHYHSPEEDKWKMIVATTVVVQPTRREICIFHWDAKQSRIDYRGATFPVEMD